MLLCGVSAALPVGAEAAVADDGYYHGAKTVKTVWDANSDDGKYPQHRIPGIVVTKKDTVIIYCEARTGNTSNSLKKSNDWCLMDIYIQRSEDGGETFGEPIYIAKGNKETACVNNPVMIVGNDNTLHMLYCKNYSIRGGGLWYRRSTDDGLTWSKEVEISKFAESVPHDCFAFGPTHGICTRDGVLMSAVWLVPKGEGRDGDTAHGPSKTYVFYSKDNGATWALSKVASGNSNETDIAELSDGSIILNSRATPRKITTSPNGINNWTTTYSDQQLPDPGCCAGLVAVNLPGLPYAHLFTNCANSSERTNVTLRVSFDDCITWELPLLIDQYNGGYSDVAIDSKGKVYVLFEWAMGNRMRLYTCSFVDEFLSKTDSLRRVEQEEFLFNTQEALTLASNFKNVEGSITDGALRLTATQSKKHSFNLDFTSLTKNINLTQNRVMAIRIRVNSKMDRDFVLGAYFQSGRLDSYYKEKYHKVSVSNDGEWHTVLMNLDEGGVSGMLSGMRLELYTDTLTCKVGDTVDIASIGFYSDMETAKEALGLNVSESDEPTVTEGTPTQSSTDPVEQEAKGCKSAASVLAGLFTAISALPLLKKRRRK